MEQKMQFISLAATGRFSVTQLCEDFEISRKTGHKWLSRYAEQGSVGLRSADDVRVFTIPGPVS